MDTHEKATRERPDDYPARALKDGDPIAWEQPFPDYAPVDYTSPKVLKGPDWADPLVPQGPFESFEGPVSVTAEGYPLNPCGRTGLTGRGLLGRWGANLAADPVVTRLHPGSGELEMIAIYRHDCHQWAIPGGMVDRGEKISGTLARELAEEALGPGAGELEAWFRRRFQQAELVYAGYSDDRRNTDNAWMETQVYHLHLSPEEAERIHLQAGDDAARAQWLPITPETIGSLYSNHGEFVARAVSRMRSK